MKDEFNIDRFLDEEKKIKIWPAKRDLKIEILKYLAQKFETGVIYSEKEVNEIIKNWHTFSDFFLLRRGLIDMKYLTRTKDGLQYWKEEENNH